MLRLYCALPGVAWALACALGAAWIGATWKMDERALAVIKMLWWCVCVCGELSIIFIVLQVHVSHKWEMKGSEAWTAGQDDLSFCVWGENTAQTRGAEGKWKGTWTWNEGAILGKANGSMTAALLASLWNAEVLTWTWLHQGSPLSNAVVEDTLEEESHQNVIDSRYPIFGPTWSIETEKSHSKLMGNNE